MSKAISNSQKGSSAMRTGDAGRSDAELMQAIVDDRDRAAFEMLYERHKDHVYTLLYSIVHDANDAEDALQETFFRIWKASVRHFDSIPSWILRVAAREGLRIHRLRGRKNATMYTLDGKDEFHYQHEIPASRSPDQQVVTLREQVQKLEPDQQRLLALYFGANLSQEEIATALDLTQQAVSTRIQKLIDRLRLGLCNAVATASMPLPVPHLLHEVFTTGCSAPPVHALCSGYETGTSVLKSNCHTGAVISGRALAVGAAALLMLVAGFVWWMLYIPPHGMASPEAYSTPEQIAPARPAAPTPAAIGDKVFRSWTFDSPMQTEGLQVLSGSWHHEPSGGTGNSGCMVSDTPTFMLQFNFPLEVLPIVLSMDASPMFLPGKSEGMNVNVFWNRDLGAAIFHNAGEPSSSNSLQGFRVFVTARTVDTWVGPARSNLFATERQDPGACLVLAITRCRVRLDSLTLSDVAPQDLPDVSAQLRALDALAQPQRRNGVALPSLASPQTGKKVWLTFFPPADLERKSVIP